MRKRTMLITFGVTFVLLTAMFNSSSEGSQYRGEVLWTGTGTITYDGQTPQDIPYAIKGGISYVGGNYYLMQAIIEMPGNNPAVYSGGGVMVGDYIIFTMTGAQDNLGSGDSMIPPSKDADISQIRVNKNTLEATAFGFGRSRYADGSYLGYYFTGTVSATPPLIPLSKGLGYLPLMLK